MEAWSGLLLWHETSSMVLCDDDDDDDGDVAVGRKLGSRPQ